MKRDERAVHKAIVHYLRHVLPHDALVHHSANEGNRGGKRGLLDGARHKAMGKCAGWPDLEVATGGDLLFIEVKAEGGRLSKSQRHVRDLLLSQGFKYAVCRSVDDVRERLSEWGVKTREAVK